MWNLFISICTSAGLCAWFEVTNPTVYKTERECVLKGQIIVDKVVEETQTKYGKVNCIEHRYADEYRIWLYEQSK